LWTGVAVALLTAALTLLVGRFVGRQVQLTRLKNDLIATVSHELKTPLAGIRALVDTLLDQAAPDPVQAREYLQLIARENLRLSRLIDNFLAFSRMERNKHAFEFAAVAPAEVVAAAVEAAGERFAGPLCRLETKVAPALPNVTADRDALLTVLLNLLDNAYKYTGEDKRIHLRAWAGAGGVCFEVQDNGIGLSRRAARRVFDRFYQVDRHLSRQAGGCGLGLSIVKFIVEAHGGHVEVKSQPGGGSTFVVTLPVEVNSEQ
jgi:signal transduction histidine kinase